MIHRAVKVIGLVLCFCMTARMPAAEPARLGDALALQEAFQDVIKKAEPSVACVVVSRSDIYQRWFGDTPSENPYKLGGFDPTLRLPIPDHPEYLEVKRALERKSNRAVRDEDVRRLYDLGDPANVPEAYGSGVVLDEKGLVLTNYHVIREATKVYVRLPGGKGSYADIHAANQRSDLAVLRLLDTRILPVPALTLGDGGKLRKGQFTIALANPFAAGFKDGSPSASWGIISNLRRRATVPARTELERARLPLHNFETLIQTDARLNLGCSGGALLNLRGELVGLTTSLAAITGAETPGGYALPMNAPMRAVVETLLRGEEVSWGFLGVGFEPETARRDEVRVSVIDGSAAQRAQPEGMRSGDAIISVNGMPIHDNDDLFLAISTLPAGSKARLEVRGPNGALRLATVTLDKLYVPDKIIASAKSPTFRGLRVDFASVLYQRDRPTVGIPRGVFVREVDPGSAADNARLQDAIITEVNGKEVANPADFHRAVDKAAGPVVLTVLSRGDLGGVRKVKLD